MATNWQPPFGLPFPFPPHTPQMQQQQPQNHHNQQQQPTQNAQQDQAGPSGPYQTPTAEAFPNPWANIPGLNLQSYGQNTLQSPYTPAAWPPPPSPAMWNQQMPMPFPFLQQPGGFPLPGLPFPPSPFPPHTPSQHPAPVPALSPAAQPFQPAQQQQQPSLKAMDFAARRAGAMEIAARRTEVMDSDKEDGEVSESDGMSQPPAVNGTAYREPPRSAPQSNTPKNGPHRKSHRERHNPEQQVAAPSVKVSTQQEPRLAETESSHKDISQKREESKQFVKILHSNNIGYRALAAESLDSKPLRELYRCLNLPSEPEPLPSAKAAVKASPSLPTPVPTASHSTAGGSKPITAVMTNVAQAAPAKSAPSPVDRKDYIARLQAAKKGKQIAAASATPPQTTPPAVSIPPPSSLQVSSEEQKARQTQLVKQRLGALNKKPSSPASAPVPSARPSANGAAPAMPSSPAPLVMSSPVVEDVQRPQVVPTTPFSGIPGLFMNSPLATQALQPIPNSRKRPLASDIVDVSTPIKRGSADPVNRSGDNVTANSFEITTPVVNRDGQRTNLPSRPASVNPALSTVSTPGAQTPASQARTEEPHDRKELVEVKTPLQIARERARKAYLEGQKKKAAEAASSPRPVQVNSDPQPAVQSPIKEMEQVVGPSTIATPFAFEGDSSPRDTKRLRRAKLQSELANYDAEAAARVAERARIQKQLDELTAEHEKKELEKARLRQELEELGVDTEGMPDEKLQAKKDEIVLEQQSAPVLMASSGPSTAPARPSASANGVEDMTEPARFRAPTQHMGIPGLGVSSAPVSQAQPDHGQAGPTKSGETTTRVEALQNSAAIVGTTDDSTMEVAGYTTPMDDNEDFYTPKPAEDAAVVDQARQSAAASAPDTLSEDGEVAMSESEDDYEPYEPQDLPGVTLRNTKRPGPATERRSSSDSSSSSSDAEAYEPPDVDFPISDAQLPEGDDGAMDISSSDESDSDESDIAPLTAKETRDPIASKDDAELTTSLADDLAPELQSEPGSLVTDKHDMLTQEKIDPWAFVPYESPLRDFKSYRYHPSYMQDVKGGFMSLTYSHQIDPNTPLCPTEAVGDSCTDPQCSSQHFGGMNINGEKLLVQLGTANPGKTAEERRQWNAGLRDVLKDLRRKETKDPNGIAIEIANYRRRFLNDESRVVIL